MNTYMGAFFCTFSKQSHIVQRCTLITRTITYLGLRVSRAHQRVILVLSFKGPSSAYKVVAGPYTYLCSPSMVLTTSILPHILGVPDFRLAVH